MSKPSELIVTGLDLETTGLDAAKGHRITEIGMLIQKYHIPTGEFETIGQMSKLINPKRDIPPDIQIYTGITPAMVRHEPTWEEVAPVVAKLLSHTDVFVAHNAEFDFVFLGLEMARVGQPFNDKMDVFCTMQQGRFASPLGKVPKLGELCWALDVDYDSQNAHRAIYDVEVMMEALKQGIALGYYDWQAVLDRAA